MPLPTDVRVDRAMTAFSLRYANQNYIADRVFPIAQSVQWDSKDAGKYFIYDKANMRVERDGPLGPRTPAPEVDYDVSVGTFVLGRYALKEMVTQEEIDNADQPLDPEEDATAFLTDKLLLGREYRAASIAFSSTYVTTGTTLSGTSQWSDETSNPLVAIEVAKASMAMEPNAMVMGAQVWQYLRHHPDIVDRFKYSIGAGVTTAQFADLLGMDPAMIMVGNARRNTADEGQTASLSYVWGKHACLAYIDPAPRPRTMTAFTTLQRGESRVVSEWPSNDPEGTWKKVQDRYIHKVVATDLAYLFTNAVA
jgi:hypothetical protein